MQIQQGAAQPARMGQPVICADSLLLCNTTFDRTQKQEKGAF
jgi:hypothetical protein